MLIWSLFLLFRNDTFLLILIYSRKHETKNPASDVLKWIYDHTIMVIYTTHIHNVVEIKRYDILKWIKLKMLFNPILIYDFRYWGTEFKFFQFFHFIFASSLSFYFSWFPVVNSLNSMVSFRHFMEFAGFLSSFYGIC